eukprot:COSAG06_NODE_199_length_20418_cov_43.318421_11_plen_157_part_00
MRGWCLRENLCEIEPPRISGSGSVEWLTDNVVDTSGVLDHSQLDDAIMKPQEVVVGMSVVLTSDSSKVGTVLKRDGARVRVDFGDRDGRAQWKTAAELEPRPDPMSEGVPPDELGQGTHWLSDKLYDAVKSDNRTLATRLLRSWLKPTNHWLFRTL